MAIGALSAVAGPLIFFVGGTSPSASASNSTTDSPLPMLPRSVTAIPPPNVVVSPAGLAISVWGPASTCAGATSPSASEANTVTFAPARLATAMESSNSRSIPSGKANCVLAPRITRVGATSPLASGANTRIEALAVSATKRLPSNATARSNAPTI